MGQTYFPDNVTRAEIDHRFDYHAYKQGQTQRMVNLRGLLGSVAQVILDETPCSYEQHKALERLEECGFWVHEAISRNE